MHELAWITIFCYSWGDLPMIFTSDEVGKSPPEWPKIVIHGNECIILFRTSYFMSWTHHSATNTHCSLISLLTLRTVNFDLTLWWHNSWSVTSLEREVLALWRHIRQLFLPTGRHHCGQTLTIDHMLLECALLQKCRDEYYTVDSLNALFETIPETSIVEFLREAGFFYVIWCFLLTSTSPQYWTIWSDLSNCLENESNS